MRFFSLLLAFGCAFACLPVRAGTMVEGKIDAQDLAEDLGFQVKKGAFKFETPMYAKAEFVYVGNESGQGNVSGTTSLVTDKPSREIPFYYIFRNQQPFAGNDFRGKSLRLSLGGTQAITYCFLNPLVGAKAARGAQSSLPLPPYDGEPIPYVAFYMSSDEKITFETAPVEAVKTMRHGYSLTFYFSPKPFKKTEGMVELRK